jgi:hypothetical protein
LWALWVYAYATLKTLQSEVETLPQFYGMYLYKENARSRLEGAAQRMTLLEGGLDTERSRVEGPGEAEGERFDLLFGQEEALIVVERAGFRILHPSEPPFGAAEFLGEPAGREAFLRTLRQMDENGLRGGYLSIDTSNAADRPNKRCWFLTMAPVGEALLSVLSVSEEQVRLSGAILEEAKKNLLEQRRRRFIRLTLPVVVLSSLFIVILYRQSRQSNRGGGT